MTERNDVERNTESLEEAAETGNLSESPDAREAAKLKEEEEMAEMDSLGRSP